MVHDISLALSSHANHVVVIRVWVSGAILRYLPVTKK